MSKEDRVLITYPEDDCGHQLISCLNCGKIYSVSTSKMVYQGPSLDQKLKGLKCVQCGNDLSATYHNYPEKYLSDQTVVNFEHPMQIPDDSESFVLEFDEVY